MGGIIEITPSHSFGFGATLAFSSTTLLVPTSLFYPTHLIHDKALFLCYSILNFLDRGAFTFIWDNIENISKGIEGGTSKIIPFSL